MAELSGEIDADAVANRLTAEQLNEWMAYGYLEGWFPFKDESAEAGKMTPEQLLESLNSGYKHPRPGV